MKNNYSKFLFFFILTLSFSLTFFQESYARTNLESNQPSVKDSSECMAFYSYEIDSLTSGNNTIQFTDMSEGSFDSWYWNFGDGFYSYEQNPVHEYSESGSFEVCLTIMSNDSSDNDFCYDTYCSWIDLDGITLECNANFTYLVESDSSLNTIVQFTDLSTGSFDSWFWSFGDDSYAYVQNPVHEYTEGGIYEVCLTIVESDTSGADFCYDTYCSWIYVGDSVEECNAYFTYEVDSDSSLNPIVQFIDMSTGNFDTWYWSFGDGFYSYEQNPVHEYSYGGTFEVCLTIMSNDSTGNNFCYDTYCSWIYVGDSIEECNAYYSYQIDPDSSISQVFFTDMSTGSFDTWYWSFGDGYYSMDQNPIHEYNVGGTFEVCLTIMSNDSTGNNFCYDTYCNWISVGDSTENYNLGGTILTDSIPIDEGFSYAYQIEQNQIVDVFASFISQYGYYDFYQIPGASYIIKTELSPNSVYSGEYIPTYYGNVAHWADAIQLELQNNTWDADITLIPIYSNSISGDGIIEGIVTYPGKGVKAEDIQVNLTNSEGLVVGLEYTDDNGIFSFENLPYDTYSLLVEIIGKDASTLEIVLDAINPIVDNISFVIYDESITLSVFEELPAYISFISEIYPNPVITSASIDFSLSEPKEISVNLFSMTGKLVYSSKFNGISGLNKIPIVSEQLSGGVYYLKVIFEGQFVQTRKLIKID